MPEVTGTFEPPRLALAPANPVPGQMYYDTQANILFWWNGTTWVPAQDAGASMVSVYDSDQVGVVKMWTGTTIPTNWALANGASLLRASYPDLFTAIGTQYGAVDGAHFNLPNLTNKFVYGAAAPLATNLNLQGGEVNHTLSSAEIPAHTHPVTGGVSNAGAINTGTESADHAHALAGYNVPASTGGWSNRTQSSASGGYNYPTQNAAMANITATSGRNAAHYHQLPAHGHGHTIAVAANTGGGSAHNNLPPYIQLAYIIKVTGAQINTAGALQGPQGVPGPQGAQGNTGLTGPAGPAATAEYGLQLGAGAMISCTSIWNKLPAGAIVNQSTDTSGLRYNSADGTITILQNGWYVVTADTTGGTLTTGSAAQASLWYTTNDTSPTPPTSFLIYQESSTINNGQVVHSLSVAAYLTANTRVGVALYNRGAATNFNCFLLSAVRLGSGPQGTQGTQGIQGNTGIQGPQGNQGDKGDTGDIGPQGVVEIYEMPYDPTNDGPVDEGSIWIDSSSTPPSFPAQPPSGPAGGDLTGNYPNPTLTAAAVAKLPPVDAFHLAALAANWSTYAAGWSDARYFKDLSGVVHITGMLKKSIAVVASEVIFTLPVGYRPLTVLLFTISSNSALGRVDINGNGQVVLQTGNAAWVSLEGISFRAEQ